MVQRFVFRLSNNCTWVVLCVYDGVLLSLYVLYNLYVSNNLSLQYSCAPEVTRFTKNVVNYWLRCAVCRQSSST